jgi:hypothetical protein
MRGNIQRGKHTSSVSKAKPVYHVPSHIGFSGLIDIAVRGKSHPVLKTSWDSSDHAAQICVMVLDDTYPFLLNAANCEGSKINKIIRRLEDRVSGEKDLNAAKTLYAIATQTAFDVLGLYLHHRELFDQIAPRREMLPGLFSIHPDTANVMERMRRDSRLGARTRFARQVGSKAYFISDAPANIYARAIIHSIEINGRLESIESQQAGWAAFDRKEGVQIIVMPFPEYVRGIEQIPVPMTADNVMQYWRKGKEIILEEMPDFHLRPEWDDYRNRRAYQTGRKKGAIQHAIFKDILAALRTIAGSNHKHRRTASKPVTK